MNTSNIGRTFSVAVVTLALTAITQVSHAASEAQSVTDPATAQSMSVAAVSEQHRGAGNRSPLTLFVEDPNGKALQLVYVEGRGWKYGRPKSHDSAENSLFHKIAFWSVTSAPAARDDAQNDETMTVFIDGPTGFTYVWTRDGGWKFVGTLSDRKS